MLWLWHIAHFRHITVLQSSRRNYICMVLQRCTVKIKKDISRTCNRDSCWSRDYDHCLQSAILGQLSELYATLSITDVGLVTWRYFEHVPHTDTPSRSLSIRQYTLDLIVWRPASWLTYLAVAYEAHAVTCVLLARRITNAQYHINSRRNMQLWNYI